MLCNENGGTRSGSEGSSLNILILMCTFFVGDFMNMKYMKMALNEANKAFLNNEVPVGAVIVENGKVLAIAHNKKEEMNCSIFHAEILAIEEACKKKKSWRLENCDIYVTLDPCPMCASAIKQSRIKNVYSALNNSDDENNKLVEKIFLTDRTNPGVNFETNLCVNEASDLLKKFFSLKRIK